MRAKKKYRLVNVDHRGFELNRIEPNRPSLPVRIGDALRSLFRTISRWLIG